MLTYAGADMKSKMLRTSLNLFFSISLKMILSVERPAIRAGSGVFFLAPSRFVSRTNRPAAVPSSAEGIFR
jgi:hypothetical protein